MQINPRSVEQAYGVLAEAASGNTVCGVVGALRLPPLAERCLARFDARNASGCEARWFLRYALWPDQAPQARNRGAGLAVQPVCHMPTHVDRRQTWCIELTWIKGIDVSSPHRGRGHF